MNQELQYLREELNQRVLAHAEQTNKVINTILVIWGGAFTILGAGITKFIEIGPENTPLYFLEATIFFISNLILYFAARQYHFFADEIFKLSAYIAVFYERQPSKDVKVGKNFCWELANFKIMTDNLVNSHPNKIFFIKRNGEYKVLILISLVPIIISSVFIFMEKKSDIRIFLLAICVIYIVSSIIISLKVPKYTSSKDNYTMKVQHLDTFFQYALDMGHYTLEEIQDRFGNVYEICKQHLQNKNTHAEYHSPFQSHAEG